MDAQRLVKAFTKHCFRSVLSVNEFVTLPVDGAVLAFRVTAAHTLDAAAQEVRPQHADFVLQVMRRWLRNSRVPEASD